MSDPTDGTEGRLSYSDAVARGMFATRDSSAGKKKKMTATRFGKKRFEHFVVAASAAAARINTEREQVLGAGVVNKLRQSVAGAGNSRVDDAIRKARKIGRNRLASTFQFLEECGQPVDGARRKPAIRAAKKIRGGAAKKNRK